MKPSDLPPEFIEISEIHDVVIDLKYATLDNFMSENVYGDFNRAYLHVHAAEKFFNAIQKLKASAPELKFIVYDALRPRSAQYKLWNKVKGTDQQEYVANPDNGSVHNYGFALDLSLVNQRGVPLDMGTGFDEFTSLAKPSLESEYLASGQLSKTQLANRMILRDAMVGAGFIQLPHEWWHYDALPKAEVKAKYTILE